MNCLGQLKLALMQHGVGVSEETKNHPEISLGIFLEKEREEVVFSLAEDFFVRTFLTPPRENCPQLKIKKENLFLEINSGEVEIRIIPPTRFLTNQRKNRNPVSANIGLDGYCLNLFLRTVGKKKDVNMTRNDVLSVIQSAFEEGVADLIQINMDYSDEVDRGFSRFSPLVEAIKKHFRAFVSFRGFPPDDVRTLDSLYASGIDLLDFPLEGFFKEAPLEQIMPRSQVIKSLEYAVGVFPQGSVSTELVFGEGPIEPVMETIDHLTAKGIIPLMKIPEKGIENDQEYDRIKRVAKHLAEASVQNKLNLKWLYPSSRLITPLDTSFFTEPKDKARLALRPVYKSTLGKKASEGFAALRRKLRVKNISDSYESAGL